MPSSNATYAHDVKKIRDLALKALVEDVPFIQFLGVYFERCGDELTGVLPYSEKFIGNPELPAIHGGVTAAFLEVTSLITLSWTIFLREMNLNTNEIDNTSVGGSMRLPKTIDFSVDYLRSGLPVDAYARATISRSGRRYASVQVEAWQDTRHKLFAHGTCHFLMPEQSK
ncbi:MAG: PaaI family thioesterase [Aestuariivita sp.]|nr:PaaI family thioesterase [Aestuariivita sp.]